MYKSMSFFKYNPNLSIEECERHYRNVHTPLIIESVRAVPGFRAYVQNRVLAARAHRFNERESVEIEPAFDRIVEMFWDSVPNLASGEGGRKAFADHPNFMDTDAPVSMTHYVVEEVVAFGKNFRAPA